MKSNINKKQMTIHNTKSNTTWHYIENINLFSVSHFLCWLHFILQGVLPNAQCLIIPKQQTLTLCNYSLTWQVTFPLKLCEMWLDCISKKLKVHAPLYKQMETVWMSTPLQTDPGTFRFWGCFSTVQYGTLIWLVFLTWNHCARYLREVCHKVGR